MPNQNFATGTGTQFALQDLLHNSASSAVAHPTTGPTAVDVTAGVASTVTAGSTDHVPDPVVPAAGAGAIGGLADVLGHALGGTNGGVIGALGQLAGSTLENLPAGAVSAATTALESAGGAAAVQAAAGAALGGDLDGAIHQLQAGFGGADQPGSDTAHTTTGTSGQAVGAGNGISHGFWDLAAAASGMTPSAGSSAGHGLGLATAGLQAPSFASQAVAQHIDPGGMGAHSDLGAHADAVQPAQHVDPGSVHVQIDAAPHVTDFSHQMHL